MKKSKNKRGRPTKYKPKYCKAIIDFFSVEHSREVPVITTYKDGSKKEYFKEVANSIPFFSAFARSINIEDGILNDWCKKYKDFNHAYNVAKGLQLEMIVANGIKDLYAQPMAIFTLKNICGWRDQVTHEVSGKGGEPIKYVVQNYASVQTPS